MSNDESEKEQLRAEVVRLCARVAELEHRLAECYRLTGADDDHGSDRELADFAVREVRTLREEQDQWCAESDAEIQRARSETREECAKIADAVADRIARFDHHTALPLDGGAVALGVAEEIACLIRAGNGQ